MLGVKLQQAPLIIAQSEKIVLFGNQLGGAAANRAIGGLGRVTHIEIVIDAVAPFVFSLFNGLRRLFQRAQNQLLNAARVFRRSGAHEIRGGDSQQLPQIAEDFLVLVHELLRSDARLFGGAFDVHAMFVGPGEVGDVVSAHAFVARNHVADDSGIGRADMRPRVRVINGRGEVILGFGIVHELLVAAARAAFLSLPLKFE